MSTTAVTPAPLNVFSFLARFGAADEERRNLIQYQSIKRSRDAKSTLQHRDPEYQQLMQLLSDVDEEIYSRQTAAVRDVP